MPPDLSKLPLEIAQMDVRTGSADAFARELVLLIPLLKDADGCEEVTIYQSFENSCRFRLLLRWRTIEHHLAFRETQSAQIVRELFGRFVVTRAATEHVFAIGSSNSPALEKPM